MRCLDNWGKRQGVQNGSEEDEIFGGRRESFPIGRATRLPLGGPVYSEACLGFICEFVRVESTTRNFSFLTFPLAALSCFPNSKRNG
ncbi:hypothetical protein TNCT_724681 [Trichonephila clavata]|uniref:Uncharacterized protein n=1 Tax=Trichonephila clavata TaxID=2740835 RepID=A0A8X6G6H8_TRICU|nr:hypothetical protein TNCT_724681 [Trichonephila clavata]